MKAIFFERHGGPEVLEYGDVAEPVPGPGEVRVRLHAAALNRLDLWTREGWPGIRLALPHIPGADGAGVIAGVGEGVADPAQGTRVVINANLSCGECEACRAGHDNLCRSWKLLGEHVSGTYAESVVVPAANVVPLPDSVSYEDAAAAGLVFQTAWHSLIIRGRLRADETVLIVGASGGVNTASIQVARLAGARVLVVGSNRHKLALAESLGADVLIDRSADPDWSRAVFQATDRRGADVVVDNVIGTTLAHSLRAARKGGRILTVGNTGGATVELDNRFVFGKHLSLIGSTMGTRSDFDAVMGLVFAGRLRPVVDRGYALSDAAEAQRRLARGEQQGKITLRIP